MRKLISVDVINRNTLPGEDEGSDEAFQEQRANSLAEALDAEISWVSEYGTTNESESTERVGHEVRPNPDLRGPRRGGRTITI